MPAPPQHPHFRALINEGIQLLRHTRYADAASAFQSASDLAPESAIPHAYLGISWLQQYVFGVVSLENDMYGERARAELSLALEVDPLDWCSLVTLGGFALGERKLPEARALFKKALEIKPLDPATWYTLGVTAWQDWLQHQAAAGRSILDEGVLDLNKALSLDEEHHDAMLYLSLFLRERSRLVDDEDARSMDLAAAEELFQRSKDLRSKWRRAKPGRTASLPQASTSDSDPMLREWALMALHPAPPPPVPLIAPHTDQWEGTQGRPVVRFDSND